MNRTRTIVQKAACPAAALFFCSLSLAVAFMFFGLTASAWADDAASDLTAGALAENDGEEYPHGANFDIYDETCPDGCYLYTNEMGFLLLGGRKEFETQGFVWRLNWGQFFEDEVDESGERKSCWAAYIAEVKDEAVVDGVLNIPRVLESPDTGARYPVKYISFYPGDVGLPDSVKSRVTSLVIEADGFRTTGITLEGCTKLESVDADFASLPANFFKGCSSLRSMRIGVLGSASRESVFDGYAPSNSTNGPVATSGIGEGCFNGCTSLESVVFEAGHADGARWYLTADTSVFRGCKNLKTVVYEAEQPYWTDPNGSMRDATTYDYWSSTGLHPDEYLAVDYYETQEAALADDRAETPNRTHDARLARVEYKRGTPLSLIATSDGGLSDYTCDRGLYAQKDTDGIVPDPGEGYVWAFELPYGTYGELSESCYAYKAPANDLSAGHLVDGDGAAALASMRAQAPRHLELEFSPERFYAEEDDGMTVRERTALNAYKNGYGNYVEAVEALGAGSPQLNVVVSAADGTALQAGSDYSWHFERYDPGTGKFSNVGNLAPEDGPYQMVVEGISPAYTGELRQWVFAKRHVGAVRGFYGVDAGQMTRWATSRESGYEGAAEKRPYAVIVGGTDMAGLLMGAGCAGLCDTTVSVSKPDGLGDGLVVMTSSAVSRILSFFVPDEVARAAGLNYRFAYAGGIKSKPALAVAIHKAFEGNRATFGATDLSWGDTAIVCPSNFPADCSALVAYAYALRAPVFFAEADGGVAADTLDALSGFAHVRVPGGTGVTPDATVQALRSGLAPGVDVERVGEGADGDACSFSCALADDLVAAGVADWGYVSVVDGKDPLNIAAGIDRVGYRHGVVLVSCSASDTRRIASLVQEHRDDVVEVSVVAPSADALGVAGQDAESLLAAACAGEADVTPNAGDAFAAGGCVFEPLEDGGAMLVQCYDSPHAFAEGDVVSSAYGTRAVERIPASAGVDGMSRMTFSAGDSRALDLAASSASNSFSYVSSDEGVASVSADGTVTAVGPGTACVSVREAGYQNAFVAAGRVEVCVHDAAQMNVLGAKDLYTLHMGDAPLPLGATCADAGAILVYESSNAEVVSVDSYGNASPVSPGRATVTIAAQKDGKHFGVPVRVEVRVERKPQEIDLGSDVVMLAVGKTQAIAARSSAPDATTLSYRSADESVATVDAAGVVTGVSAGTTNVRVEAPWNDEYEGAVAELLVAVSNGGVRVVGLESEYSLRVGSTLQVTASQQGYSDLATTWEYASSDEGTVSVSGHVSSGNAVLRGNAPGRAHVAFSAFDVHGNIMATWICRVTVTEDAGISLSGATITWIEGPDFPYTGKAVDPEVSVRLDGTVLKLGRDYELSVRDATGSALNEAVEAGVYTLAVKGIGAYCDEAVGTFTITAPAGDPAPSAASFAVADGQVVKVSGQNYTVISTKARTVRLTKAKNAKTVTVPATVKLHDGKAYSVRGIGPGAFSSSKAKKVVVKTTGLSKKSVKRCLKKSKVKTVQVKVGNKKLNKKFVKKYKKLFTKKNAGRKVVVK